MIEVRYPGSRHLGYHLGEGDQHAIPGHLSLKREEVLKEGAASAEHDGGWVGHDGGWAGRTAAGLGRDIAGAARTVGREDGPHPRLQGILVGKVGLQPAGVFLRLPQGLDQECGHALAEGWEFLSSQRPGAQQGLVEKVLLVRIGDEEVSAGPGGWAAGARAV